MFGSTRRLKETSWRILASEFWSRGLEACRQAYLRLAMLLQGESVAPEMLAITLDRERRHIMDLWSQLASEAAFLRDTQIAARDTEARRESHEPDTAVMSLEPMTPVPPPELAGAVELCLSRLLEALAALSAARPDSPLVLDDPRFAFTHTLAEFGRHEGLAFADLLADLLLLREALRRYLARYPLAARVAWRLIDPFLDRAAISLAREWSALGAVVAAREAEQTSHLLTISTEMLTTLDMSGVYHAVVDHARQALSADLAGLLVLTPAGDSLELLASSDGEGALQPKQQLSVADSVSGRAISTGRPFTCLDTQMAGLRPVACRCDPSGVPAASAVSAPIGTASGLIGTLEVCMLSRRIFEPHEADRLALLAGQAALIWEHDELQRRARERERAAALREIDLARRVQNALLSRHVLDAGPFRLGARLDPSREVGGDYYDLFPLGDGRAAVHIGDVSGKGIPAALLVAMARYALRAHAMVPGASPAAVLRETNALFCADISEEMAMFVTACYAILEPDPPRLVYASAGHHPPMIRRGNLVQLSTAARQAPPLGLAHGPEFHDRQVALAPGDTLVFYTDGVIEARNLRGEWFGLTGIERALRAHGDLDPDSLASAIVDAVIAHMAGQPLSDDTTVVVLKVAD